MIAKLEMLIALAQERHFGRAAESLNITQPTLSSGIKQLEAQLGVKLVQRGARFRGLTPEGQRALEMARSIVGETKRLRDEMRYSTHGPSGQIRLAVIPTALTWGARLAARCTEAHPGLRFSVRAASSQEILHMLEALECDAGITYLDNEPLGRAATQALYRETYTLVCHADDPLAGRASLGWDELAGQRLCLLTPDMQNRRIINRNFMEAGLDMVPALEASSTVVLVATVRQGGWATILPTDLAGFLAASPELRVVPLTGGHAAHAVGLVAPAQEPQTPTLRALFDAAAKLGGGSG
ncbi:LysR family transcriptional regulator [Pseudoponticoccus marisrubri]|uniref:LysR family transcriptional regulator n=1 Tax=Pseudoponticoccus marisrubri TaxID=1685382 RepID=A0A0W7WP07_9RHOB|nr:LysR family transcriptional regulator [Pseudoponticoccus marisrubri]KUF12320.1 LysR family transcriptional regulator [Pseudoponticoccus marisrubri]